MQHAQVQPVPVSVGDELSILYKFTFHTKLKIPSLIWSWLYIRDHILDIHYDKLYRADFNAAQHFEKVERRDILRRLRESSNKHDLDHFKRALRWWIHRIREAAGVWRIAKKDDGGFHIVRAQPEVKDEEIVQTLFGIAWEVSEQILTKEQQEMLLASKYPFSSYTGNTSDQGPDEAAARYIGILTGPSSLLSNHCSSTLALGAIDEDSAALPAQFHLDQRLWPVHARLLYIPVVIDRDRRSRKQKEDWLNRNNGVEEVLLRYGRDESPHWFVCDCTTCERRVLEQRLGSKETRIRALAGDDELVSVNEAFETLSSVGSDDSDYQE